jgi:hypothetical protein
MPIPRDYENLIDRLVTLTHRRGIPWMEGSSEWMYLAPLQGFSVKLEDSGATDGVDYSVAIVNKDGEDVDSFTVTSADDADFGKIRDLWWTVRRQVARVDDAIRAIERQLEEILRREEEEEAERLKETPKSTKKAQAPAEEEE